MEINYDFVVYRDAQFIAKIGMYYAHGKLIPDVVGNGKSVKNPKAGRYWHDLIIQEPVFP